MLVPVILIGTYTLSDIFFKIIIWLPVGFIIISNFNKKFVKRYPYTLPLTNFIFIFAINLLAVKEFLWL
jgi:hypothetical protein